METVLANVLGPDALIVVGVIVLLFGGSQLPKLARSVGEAKKEFEKTQREEKREERREEPKELE